MNSSVSRDPAKGKELAHPTKRAEYRFRPAWGIRIGSPSPKLQCLEVGSTLEAPRQDPQLREELQREQRRRIRLPRIPQATYNNNYGQQARGGDQDRRPRRQVTAPNGLRYPLGNMREGSYEVDDLQGSS